MSVHSEHLFPDAAGGGALGSDVWIFEGWARYEPIALIGEGGMGRVYRACDRTIGREVALKLIRDDRREAGERLIREARFQGQVAHPHVCPVYDAGVHRGRAFIAMKYVDGPTLADAGHLPELEKIRICRAIAEAIHAAHIAGLIHRDIKPTNILLERTGAGTWWPYVTDFGLARDSVSTGMTSSGVIAGTPHYLAPEQVTGSFAPVDPRVDVYSLGVTMYELFSGQLPFQAETTAALLIRIAGDDPHPLRRLAPSLSPDLQTVIGVCLEKAPERRYPSAQAVAEDLGRILNQEPVTARRPSLSHRITRRVRRHRAVSALIALALVLAGVLAVQIVRAEQRSRIQQHLAAELNEELAYIQGYLRHSRTSPLHDTREDQEQVRQRIERLRQRVEGAGPLATGPGHYALGRAHLEMRRYDEARRHLELSWESGYRLPEVANALGRVKGILYQQEIERSERIPDPESRAQRRSEIERRFRRPVLDLLEKSRGTTVHSPALLEATIAFYERRYDESLRRAEDALREFPWEYEAHQLRATIRTITGNQRRDVGDYLGADEDYLEAESAYQAALSIGRSDPSLHEGLCRLWNERARHLAQLGAEPETALETAVAACNDALIADPSAMMPLLLEAESYIQLASHQQWKRADPSLALDRSMDLARRVIASDPSNALGHYYLGLTHWWRAVDAFHRGEDPRSSLETVIGMIERALTLEPAFGFAHTDLGNAHLLWSDYESGHGGDPGPAIDKAIARFHQAGAIAGGYASHHNLGYALMHRARLEVLRGIDPSATFESSIAAFEMAIADNSTAPFPHHGLATALLRFADWRMEQGLDSSAMLDQTRLVLDEAEERLHDYWETDLLRGIRHRLVARGLSPSDRTRARNELLAAEASLRRAIELHPSESGTTRELAHVFLALAELPDGRNGLELRRAIEWADRALEAEPRNAENLRVAGMARLRLAKGRAAAAEGAEGRSMLLAALAINRNLEPQIASLLEELPVEQGKHGRKRGAL